MQADKDNLLANAPQNGKMKIVKNESNIIADLQSQKARIESDLQSIQYNARRELEDIAARQKQAIEAKFKEQAEKRAEMFEQADLLKARADELPIGSSRQLEFLTKAENLKRSAKSIVLPDDEVDCEQGVITPTWYARNRTVIMALVTSMVLAGAFWIVMKWIKVEDPQAVPYDATTFQKFLVTACFFSALQALKSFAILIYYPAVHLFKSNVQEPNFDFSNYFKNKLTPIQQVCISLFIPCWFALEFVLLFSAKF
jgi:hypothetical protein